MENTGNVSLIEAFGGAIESIISQSTGQWLYCKEPPETDDNRLIDDEQALLDYEHVWAYEKHFFTEIFVCAEGECALHTDGSYLRMLKGNVAVILPGTIHSEMTKRNGSYTGIWISINNFICMLHLSGKRADTCFFSIVGKKLQKTEGYNRLIDNLYQDLKEPTRFSYELAKSILMQILIEAYAEITRPVEPDLELQWKETIIKLVKKHIEKNISKQISLEEIAHEAFISQNYLNSLFKSETGKTIMQYISDYRIDKAKILLATTNIPIKCIAADLGYYDQYHFSKSFKKACGVSPSDFRGAV